MPIEFLIFLTVFTPALVGGLNLIFNKNPNVRDTVTLLGALITFYFSANIFLGFDGQATQYKLATIMPGIDISFHIEPLGIVFSLLASGLWILIHIYAIGYMRGAKEKNHSRFFFFFSVSIASVMGISFSGNLFTLFLFYEILTLITFPLVSHKGSNEALRGARVYLSILLGTSIGLQLLGIIWIYFSVGTLDFVKGGILNASFGSLELILLVALFAFGIGKAALFPFHRWLPAAMVAPTPVSALLHAVAVVHVPIDDQHALDAQRGARDGGGDAHVVEQAEAHRLVVLAVVPGGPDVRKSVRQPPVDHRLAKCRRPTGR